jgi:hypothetical protein
MQWHIVGFDSSGGIKWELEGRPAAEQHPPPVRAGIDLDRRRWHCLLC